MRRSALAFLTASLLVHAGLGEGGAWLARRGQSRELGTPKVVFAGETFDIQAVDDRAAPSPSVVAPVERPDEQGVTAAPRAQIAARGDSSSEKTVQAPLTFGAMGDRSATSLIVAVSRGFPQAASTDPVWRGVSFGDAGDATLEIELEADGTLARWSLGPGASPALRQAMVRTMALVGGRAFVARGAVTKLRVAARVSPDAVRDGTDAVYAIHSEHEGDHALAFFSLASGRRVDLVITALK
ncbi:MAG TPA: hypothetical protein VGH28_30680 [Polyangiaceae bacterium]|jgi:hypothetical protein